MAIGPGGILSTLRQWDFVKTLGTSGAAGPVREAAAMSRKRIAQPEPQTPAHQAARHLLRARLRSVGRLVADISAKRVQRPEYIHQLRVSIRRADAAINAFEPCIGPSEVAKTRKRLRTLRKAAGATRDCDSHAAILSSLLTGDSPDHKLLAKYLDARLKSARCAAAERALDAARPGQSRRLKKARKALVRSVAMPQDVQKCRSLERAAADTLASTLAATRTAAREDLKDLNNLHGLRVAAKQVRYVVELFRCCLPGTLCDSSLAYLREFQSLLGRVNDARQMASWLADEAVLLAESRRPKGIPRGATAESIHEELRVLLGRFEAEREATHAAAIPEVPAKLDAALGSLEDWVRSRGVPVSHAAEHGDRLSAGRDAEGPEGRLTAGVGARRVAAKA